MKMIQGWSMICPRSQQWTNWSKNLTCRQQKNKDLDSGQQAYQEDPEKGSTAAHLRWISIHNCQALVLALSNEKSKANFVKEIITRISSPIHQRWQGLSSSWCWILTGSLLQVSRSWFVRAKIEVQVSSFLFSERSRLSGCTVSCTPKVQNGNNCCQKGSEYSNPPHAWH